MLIPAALLPQTPGPESPEGWWKQRDRGFDSGQMDPTPTRNAIAAWEAVLQREPKDPRVPFRLMEALWFDATFLQTEAEGRAELAERILVLATSALERLPPEGGVDPVSAHFWAAVAWGFWGMTHGNLASARRGVAKRIRDHAERVIALDPERENAGGYRLLGRLNTVAPRVPFFSLWIDRDRGLECLEEALAISDEDPRNAFFLAEALLEYRPQRRTEALALLESVAGRRPRPSQRVEDSATLDEARQRLAKARR